MKRSSQFTVLMGGLILAAVLMGLSIWLLRLAKPGNPVVKASVPIVFYGRFVDQSNAPVPGVAVLAQVNGWNPANAAASDSSTSSNVFYSDAQGKLVIQSVQGEMLNLSFQKDGYELAPKSPRSFTYGPDLPVRHLPDPTNPVVYRMWKRLGGAELVGYSLKKSARADGMSLSLDLDSGLPVIEATNLPGPTVRVWREPLLFDFQTNLPNVWSYELVWPGGKVQPTTDTFCYLAPVDGYRDKLGAEFRRGDPNYRHRDVRSFYFMNRQGQYGRGKLEILVDREGSKSAMVILDVLWNPDGSRNLEPKVLPSAQAVSK